MSERSAGRGRVLVVEDEAYVRDSLVEILRTRRLDASAAASVAGALVHLERAPVDVVLSDLRMPGADGLELVRRKFLHACCSCALQLVEQANVPGVR